MKALLLAVLIVLPTIAWGPIQRPYWEPPVKYARAYVEAKARQYGVPAPLALAVWMMEGSHQVYCRDGTHKERGCWQLTRRTAKAMGCRWRMMRLFRVSTDCGMRYLAKSLRLCKSLTRAANRYNTGRCLKRNKVWGYGQKAGRLIMKYQDEA